jgi:hypothetical protein
MAARRASSAGAPHGSWWSRSIRGPLRPHPLGSDVTTLIGSELATPDAKARMLAAIDSIAELGGTNISGGVEAAVSELERHRSAFGVSRIVLMSDGQANEGIADPAGLSAMARRISSQNLTLLHRRGLDFNERGGDGVSCRYGGGSYHSSPTPSNGQHLGGELQQAGATVAIGTRWSSTPPPASPSPTSRLFSELSGGPPRPPARPHAAASGARWCWRWSRPRARNVRGGQGLAQLSRREQEPRRRLGAGLGAASVTPTRPSA